MATEEGVVTKLAIDTAWVKTSRTAACKGCAAKTSCHVLGGGGTDMEVEAINTAGARVGDRIVLSFETAALLKATFLIYVFPILGMLAGAVIGQQLALVFNFDQSIFSVFFGFLFFSFALIIIKLNGKRMAEKNEYKPKIIRILHKGGAILSPLL